MYHPISYIDHGITIHESIPYSLQFIIDEMEKYDQSGSVLYFSSMDDFVDAVKNCYVAGCFSEATWKLLEQKYVYHALKVSKMEDEHYANINI